MIQNYITLLRNYKLIHILNTANLKPQSSCRFHFPHRVAPKTVIHTRQDLIISRGKYYECKRSRSANQTRGRQLLRDAGAARAHGDSRGDGGVRLPRPKQARHHHEKDSQVHLGPDGCLAAGAHQPAKLQQRAAVAKPAGEDGHHRRESEPALVQHCGAEPEPLGRARRQQRCHQKHVRDARQLGSACGLPRKANRSPG